jgi:hypothetical protein
MYRNHWVTSDVQIRKEALIPPFWVGLGWADYWFETEDCFFFQLVKQTQMSWRLKWSPSHQDQYK